MNENIHLDNQQKLGHAKTSTTLDIYTHAIKARDTGAADTLDTLFDNKKQA